jgi:hypothetical protein
MDKNDGTLVRLRVFGIATGERTETPEQQEVVLAKSLIARESRPYETIQLRFRSDDVERLLEPGRHAGS